ncbi:MAG: DMT family transporter [Candidatus Aminicenantes bacterium]|nr:DMT family transporter [Candidatus Aminicenantes bacterium]
MKIYDKHLIALLSAIIFWGTALIVVKDALNHMGPMTIAAARFVIAFLVLLPFALKRGYTLKKSFEFKYILLGFIGYAATFIFQNFGLIQCSAATAAIIQASLPIVTVIIAYFLISERLNLQKGLGTVLAVFGVILAAGSGLSLDKGTSLLGIILVFFSMVSWGLYSTLLKRFEIELDVIAATTAFIGGGLLLLLPLAGIEIIVGGWPDLNIRSFIALLYLGLLCSLGGISLWNFALKKVEAGLASIYYNLVPIVGILAAVLYGERVGSVQILGCIITITGVVAATMSKKTPYIKRSTRVR